MPIVSALSTVRVWPSATTAPGPTVRFDAALAVSTVTVSPLPIEASSPEADGPEFGSQLAESEKLPEPLPLPTHVYLVITRSLDKPQNGNGRTLSAAPGANEHTAKAPEARFAIGGAAARQCAAA